MRGRLLYGYRRVGERIVVDPVAAAVVCAVLAVPRRRGRLGLGAAMMRRLLADAGSACAVSDRIARIRRHAADYRCGRARADLAPSAALILSGSALVRV